jgi:hypothetical protein
VGHVPIRRRDDATCSPTARPGSFAAIWDDILPAVPEEIWRANVDAVVAALEE